MLFRSVLIIAVAFAASACDSATAGSSSAGVAAAETSGAGAQLASAVAEPDPDGAETDLVQAQVPATALPLTLLATLAGEDARATIRDDDGGVIASYRVGEEIRTGVKVVGIEPRGVALDEQGVATRLPFGEGPAAVSADDVYYPDLARFDDLPHSMADAVQLEDGEGYVVKAPAFAWGTPRTIAALREGIRAHARAESSAPDVYVGDLSKRDGGPFPPHLSHQSGRDVDIGFVHQGSAAGAKRFVRAAPGNLDLERTWSVLAALMETGEVGYVFVDYEVQRWLFEWAAGRGINPARLAEWFQYPRGRSAMHGVIRHWKGHADHMHVRFKQ